MRFAFHEAHSQTRISADLADRWFDVNDLNLPFSLKPETVTSIDEAQNAASSAALESTTARVFCVGLNYGDQASESETETPAYPVIFLRTYERFASPDNPVIKPARFTMGDGQEFRLERLAQPVSRDGGRYGCPAAERHLTS